jgi:hypothetical protein
MLPGFLRRDPESPSLARWQAVLLFFLLAAFFIGVPIHRFDTEALKQSMSVPGEPEVAAVNHPYSGKVFYYWWRLVSELGVGEPGFDRRLVWIGALNGLLGAGGIVLLVDLVRRQGANFVVSVAAGLLLALTHAWYFNAAQPMEPMLAAFFLLLSLWFAANPSDSSAAGGMLSGAAWAMSVAAYQSYFLAGPGVLLIAFTRFRRATAWIVAAGVVGVVLFSAAAVARGAHNVSGVIAYLTDKPDGEYWGFIRLSSLPQLPVGLAQAISPPWPMENWGGLRTGFATLGGLGKLVLVAQVLITVAIAILACLRPGPKGTGRLRMGLLWIFLAGLFPPFYLLPYYNKLWIMPLLALFALGGLAAARIRQGGAILIVLLIGLIAINSRNMIHYYHREDNTRTLAGRALSAAVGPRDLLICDGWDDSAMYLVQHPERETVALMYEREEMSPVDRRVKETWKNGNRVFIYGLLELSEAEWTQHDIGKRPGHIQRLALDPYRPLARLVWKGPDLGFPGNLYELVPR